MDLSCIFTTRRRVQKTAVNRTGFFFFLLLLQAGMPVGAAAAEAAAGPRTAQPARRAAGAASPTGRPAGSAAACDTEDLGPMTAQMAPECANILISAATTGSLPTQTVMCRCLTAVPVGTMPGCKFGGMLLDANAHASCVWMGAESEGIADKTWRSDRGGQPPKPPVHSSEVRERQEPTSELTCGSNLTGDTSSVGSVHQMGNPSNEHVYSLTVTATATVIALLFISPLSYSPTRALGRS